MNKAYIYGWKKRTDGPPGHTEFSFTSTAGEAFCWETRQEAEIDCQLFNRFGVWVETAKGGRHLCENFQVEELTGRDLFVISGVAPFCKIRYYGVVCGACGKKLKIGECRANAAMPDFDLRTEIGWVCSRCGFISHYEQGCLTVFDKPEGVASLAPALHR